MSSFIISELTLSYYFFKVPEITQEQIIPKKVHNILLCDSSGSMSEYWAKVANGWNGLVEKLDGSVSLILFSNTAFRHPGKTLPLHMVQSGGTDILKGLEELEREIKNHKMDDLIRVFFITDGEDGSKATFQ